MLYDIAFPLSARTMIYDGDPPFCREVLLDTAKGDLCTLSLCHFGSHLGTHIDFPRHFFSSGSDAATFPLERLCGSAKVFCLHGISRIQRADLERLDIQLGDRVLLRTDNDGFDGVHPLPHPVYLDTDGAAYLVERQVALVGIDYESPEEDNGSFPVHRMLLGAGIPILEHLRLSHVPEGTYRLYCLPLALEGGDASWVRPILER